VPEPSHGVSTFRADEREIHHRSRVVDRAVPLGHDVRPWHIGQRATEVVRDRASASPMIFLTTPG
jgi:hypothetical protein